jgi:hypothetical protein
VRGRRGVHAQDPPVPVEHERREAPLLRERPRRVLNGARAGILPAERHAEDDGSPTYACSAAAHRLCTTPTECMSAPNTYSHAMPGWKPRACIPWARRG